MYIIIYITINILYILNIEFSSIVPKFSVFTDLSTEQLLLVANHDSQTRQLWNG